MAGTPPGWGEASRFYLPNEDAGMIRKALAALSAPVRRPVFVGGSGMALLDALAELPTADRVCFVDLAEFQALYFQRLLAAMARAASSRELRQWFADEIYPELYAHFLQRGHEYPLHRVIQALGSRFSIRFFFDDAALHAARAALPRILVFQNDIVSHLASPSADYDFIYLSNVPDYLPGEGLKRLFHACRELNAPVYLLLTEACGDAGLVRQCWERNGFRSHAVSSSLSAQNRGLGARSLDAVWNRPGEIHLLTPDTYQG